MLLSCIFYYSNVIAIIVGMYVLVMIRFYHIYMLSKTCYSLELSIPCKNVYDHGLGFLLYIIIVNGKFDGYDIMWDTLYSAYWRNSLTAPQYKIYWLEIVLHHQP